MNQLSFRNLVGVAYSEAEMKALAEEQEVRRGTYFGAKRVSGVPAQVTDGPNDQGEMFTRPGKLSDKLPAPYANEAVRRAPPRAPLVTPSHTAPE